jgi:hypothetical protein
VPKSAPPPTESTKRPQDGNRPALEEDHDHHPHADEASEDSDVGHYADYPMSPVPHTVVRGWGARGDGPVRGHVGAFVVVSPDIDDSELERLGRDIRDYHEGATALSVRILDSMEAATDDRHSDGGVLQSEHRVGTVRRNERLGRDLIEVRGREIESDAP